MFHVEHLKRCEECLSFNCNNSLIFLMMQHIEGNIIDIHRREIYPGIISIDSGKIISINRNSQKYAYYISPGFIDAHVHIESSMLIPEEFSKLAIRRGTVAIVNDPHEIANVMGTEGIEYMIENSKQSCIKSFFTIPSCVPATPYDSSGSVLLSSDIEQLALNHKFVGLSEMMNVPGVIQDDTEVLAKIEIARRHHLTIDGHAPGLSGSFLKKYIDAGISTDHECTSLEEAIEKINSGMKILIREGSAAKNYEALKWLIADYPEKVMFCTDDSHPNDLLSYGEIDKLVCKALGDGFDLFDVLKIASFNPISHYKINVGCLREGDPADFIIVRNLNTFDVLSVYIDGIEKYNYSGNNEKPHPAPIKIINHFNRDPISLTDLTKPIKEKIVSIKVIPGELVTRRIDFELESPIRNFESDVKRDILKIVYLNRYQNTPPQIAFISGFELKEGAFATTISHDSHNIIAVGCSDKDILEAINAVILEKGGLAVKNNKEIIKLPLPIAGIMSASDGETVASLWETLTEELKQMGCKLDSPFMTLSFMSLIVIPELKIGEQGLFDYEHFKFISESD